MKNPIKSSCLILFCWCLFGLGQAQDGNLDYQLGAGDTIKINVFQNPDLAIETRVSETGAITYPLIGKVQVGGLSIAEAERTIADRLREGGFVNRPQVNMTLLQVRGSQVSVLGLVSRPGRYPIETLNTRVTDMLAMAGGPVPTGADIAILTGLRDGKPFRKEIDLPSLFLDNKPEVDFRVAGGDVIYVHRAPVFYIYGEVQRAGVYRLERDMSVLQGLAQSGGLTPRGTERALRIHRRGPDGKIQVIEPDKDQLIQANDVLYVQESLF